MDAWINCPNVYSFPTINKKKTIFLPIRYSKLDKREGGG